MIRVLCLLVLLIFSSRLNAQGSNSFASFREEVRSLWAKGDFVHSIELINSRADIYTRHAEKHTITYYLGLLYLEIDDYEKSFDIFQQGFDQQFFFSFWPAYREKILGHRKGLEIMERNEKNKNAYLKNSSAQFEILFPENYDPEHAYPLFYFLHGNNSNLENLKDEWRNVNLPEEVIVVLAQSSYPRSNYTFDWVDSTLSRRTMRNIHRNILDSLSIDSSKIIVGGFSNGGRAALDLFLDQTFPINGFIAFNPSPPKSIELLDNDMSISGKGVIITGEHDYMLARQISISHRLFALSFPLRLVVFPDHGHDYPLEFSEELGKSIQFLLDPR